MRIQTNNFARRPSKEMYENPKYFLIYEGEVTEPMYFSGLITNRNKLALNQSLSLISVLRSVEDLHKSHPKYALKMAIDIQKQSNGDYITKENLVKSIKDFITKEHFDNKENLINLANNYIENYANDFIYNNEIRNIIIDIYKEDIFQDIASNIIKYLDNQRIELDYNPSIDIINLIVDRDKGSFKAKQYNELLESCKTNNIKIYVSNPCFETWLLMHFDEFDNLDFEKLLENKRINSSKKSRKYSDKMLSDITGYDKSNLNFKIFINKIDDAIIREKRYCEDIYKLKDNIGTNIGQLIDSMRK